MCGIVSVSGDADVSARCVEGLRRLQYRGYDSFGFSFLGPTGLDRWRSIEPLDQMDESLPSSQVVTGHTRWATHGGVTTENAHPHLSRGGEFALVHNGIVENYQALKKSFAGSGYTFVTDTDTEVIVALLEGALSDGADRSNAILDVFSRLEGRNTFIAQFADGELLGIRHGSPLILGKSREAIYLASDILSFSPYTDLCCPVPEATAVRIEGTTVELFDASGRHEPEWISAKIEDEDTGLDGYAHYMLKEIMEQWRTVSQQALVNEDDLVNLLSAIRSAKRVFVTGAGGASFAARQIAYFLRHKARIDALDVPAYDFESMAPCSSPGDVLLTISQSGETADTIEAVRLAERWGMRIATLVNMPMSSLTRMADDAFYNRSGPEICVLSTKSASAQVTFGFLLAAAVAGALDDARREVDHLSRTLSHYLDTDTLKSISEIAQSLAASEHIFLLGRSAFRAVAEMGALNIKEASYIHAEAFSAGELKHGVIALIENTTPVVLFAEPGDRYMINVAAEVKSRGARVIAISAEDNELFDEWLPMPGETPDARAIAGIIPCQLLAYFLALARGVNPDKPRNLAKSVTVQ